MHRDDGRDWAAGDGLTGVAEARRRPGGLVWVETDVSEVEAPDVGPWLRSSGWTPSPWRMP
jgi:hypothetical protein